MMTLFAPWVAAIALWGDGPFNYSEVPPAGAVSNDVSPAKGDESVPDIWTLKFVYRNPRYVMVDIPGKGRRLIWYMRYYLINESGKPRTVIPQFTLVTKDGEIYKDVIIPIAQKKVMDIEDPTQKVFNSVTISKDPIPVTPVEGAPIAIHGIAFWDGGEALMNAKAFDIYVTGLSNGYVKVQPEEGADADKEPQMLRKTLRLSFEKPGDVFNPDSKEIKIAQSPAWIYR